MGALAVNSSLTSGALHTLMLAPRVNHSLIQSLPLSLWESRRTPLNKLEHFRAVATRFEKHDVNYIALVKLAAIRIWFRLISR